MLQEQLYERLAIKKKAPFMAKDSLSPQTSAMLSGIKCNPSGSQSLLTTGYNRDPTNLSNANSLDLAKALFQQAHQHITDSHNTLSIPKHSLIQHLAEMSQSSNSFK